MDPTSLTHSLEGDRPAIIARFAFEEARYPFFRSVTGLFTDLLLAHDLAVLLSYPEYEDYQFGPVFWTRGGRPLEPVHELRTMTIVKQSPLLLEVVISAAGGLWALAQIVDKVANWKLNRKKLDLEVAKLIQENALRQVEILQKQETLEESIKKRNANEIYQVLIARLSESEIRLRDLDLRSTGN